MFPPNNLGVLDSGSDNIIKTFDNPFRVTSLNRNGIGDIDNEWRTQDASDVSHLSYPDQTSLQKLNTLPVSVRDNAAVVQLQNGRDSNRSSYQSSDDVLVGSVPGVFNQSNHTTLLSSEGLPDPTWNGQQPDIITGGPYKHGKEFDVLSGSIVTVHIRFFGNKDWNKSSPTVRITANFTNPRTYTFPSVSEWGEGAGQIYSFSYSPQINGKELLCAEILNADYDDFAYVYRTITSPPPPPVPKPTPTPEPERPAPVDLDIVRHTLNLEKRTITLWLNVNGDRATSRKFGVEALYLDSSKAVLNADKIATFQDETGSGRLKRYSISIEKLFEAPLEADYIQFTVDGSDAIPVIEGDDPNNNTLIIDIPFITHIPKIMDKKGWSVAAQLMRRWFSGTMKPEDAVPAGSGPSTWPKGSWSKYDMVRLPVDWALDQKNDTNGRVDAAYRQIFDTAVVFNSPALKQFADNIRERINQRDVIGKKELKYSNPRGVKTVEALENFHRLHIQSRRFGSFIDDPLDQVYGALGKAAFYAVPTARITRLGGGNLSVQVTGYAVYMLDTFDFTYREGDWISKPTGYDDFLGNWYKDGRVEKGSLGGDIPTTGVYSVSNKDFRDFREKTGIGADFFVTSQIRTVRFSQSVRYRMNVREGDLIWDN